MIVLDQQNNLEERSFAFVVNKYYYNGGANTSVTIDATAVAENFKANNPLKIQFLLSNTRLEAPDFSDVEQFYLNDLLQDNSLTVTIPYDVGATSLYFYVYVFTEFGGPATKFTLTLLEEVVQGGENFSNNFVDLRLFDPVTRNDFEKTLQQTRVKQNIKSQIKLYNYTFISDLFYSLLPNKTISILYGFDQKSYFLQGNYLSILNGYADFESYIEENNFINAAYGLVYSEKSNLPVTAEQSSFNLKNDIGTSYEVNFKPSTIILNDELLSYKATFKVSDPQSRFVADVILPELKNEFNTINNVTGTRLIFASSISRTISLLKQALGSKFEGLFEIYDSSNRVVVDEKFKTLFINVNETFYNLFQKNVLNKIMGKPSYNIVEKDFVNVIDTKNLELATTFVDFGQSGDDQGFASVTVDGLTERRTQEATKYFPDGETAIEIEKQSGAEVVDLNALTGVYFSPESVSLNNEKIIMNNKAVDYKFNNDDFLKYGQAINKIAAYNNSLVLKTDSFILEGVTATEKKTEQQSIIVNSVLNSLKVKNLRDFRTTEEAEREITNSNNSVKTFEIPSTLRTDLCSDDVATDIQREITQGDLLETKSSFIGNNILLFSIFNAAQSFNDNGFYNFYRNYSNRELLLESLPIQSLFLYKIYNERENIPDFLKPDEMLRQFSTFSLIYFMFKNLVKVKIYIAEQKGFVNLNEEVIADLDLERDYLCRMELYESGQLGIKTPNLFKTSIYNRHFVLTA